METAPVSEAPKKNQTLLIVSGAALVLCCCCVVAAAVGAYSYTTIRSTQTDYQEPEPEINIDPTDETRVPGADLGIGNAPTGGLGNEILRNDTWQYVAFAAMGEGCDQPLGDDTQIEVLQEPQDGIWVEQWTVACASGESYAYEVEYILDDTGATFNIKSLP